MVIVRALSNSKGELKLEIETAQLELRRAFLRGGPGAIVSGLVWLVAGITASAFGLPTGFAALFFGGMLIFPVASLFVRVVLRLKPASKQNPGGITVIETIFPMIFGFMTAWLLLPYRPEFVFPMSAIAVGAHYFGFRTAYGDWANWILGGIMCLVGVGSIFYRIPTANIVPFAIAAIEFGFGCCLCWVSTVKD